MRSKKLQHGINMENFINQISKEHHLIDELVANAIEAANTRVEIIHQDDKIIIWNDGKSLSFAEIENNLLTAFETGEEKSLETNRGLGFIAIYPATTETIIQSGSLGVTIRSWKEIVTYKIDPRPGFRVILQLTEEAKSEYNFISVKNHLQNWIYWEPIEIVFGKDETLLESIGLKKDEAIQFLNHPQYNYKNLRYLLNTFSEHRIQFLYKLTNVNCYRILPIQIDLDQILNPNHIEDLTLVISHGAYLDSTRRSLTTWGYQQVEKLVELINQDQNINNLRRQTFRFKSKAIDITRKRLTLIFSEFQLEESEIPEIILRLKDQMKNNHSIVFQLSYLDKLIRLLQYSNKNVQIPEILPEVFLGFLDFVEENQPDIPPKSFHNWVEEILGVKTERFFEKTIVGFLLKQGDIVGEVTIGEIIDLNISVIEFDNQLFQSPVITKTSLVVVLHDFTWYFAEISQLRRNLDDLIQQLGRRKGVNSFLQKYSLLSDKEEMTSYETINIGREQIINNIPILVESEQELTENERQLLITDKIQRSYQFWKKCIRYILENINEEELYDVIPIILFPETKSSLACMVHNFIGISIHLLVEIPEENIPMTLLFTAIHEITHLFYRTHSSKFYHKSTNIFYKLASDNQLKVLISGYFND